MADGPILAAGALLWRQGPGGPQVAVVHRSRYDDWSLPKGKPEAGEHLTTAAVREVLEETAVRVHLGRALGTVSYETNLGPKVVHYWTAEAIDDEGFVANEEVDALHWLAPDLARERLTYPHDVDIVSRAVAAPLRTSAVLLVRHARAGDRDLWRGHDVERPLDAIGLAQARALVPVLRAFGPVGLRSARPTRCVQTLEPLAEDLEVAIVLDGALDDEVVTDGVEAAVKATRAWSLAQGSTVLCSQGDAIPALVEALCLADEVAPARPRFPSRKGSVWLLSFADGRLVSTDYMPDAGVTATW